MPLPLIGIFAVTGCLYLANKIQQKQQKKKTFKNSQPKKTIAQSVSSTKPITPRKKNDYETELNRNIILSAGLMVLSTGGALGYPLLTFLSLPGFIYLSVPILWHGYQELFKKRTIGAGVLDSVIAFVMLGLQYFFASAFFFTLYYISRKILLKTEDSSRQSLINIWGETPQFVWIEQEGVELEISFEQLQVGDVVILHAGETIPVDGIVKKGIGNVDQHILTGEAQPTEKIVADRVFASTVLLSGQLHIKVDKAGTETVAAKIKNILNNTTDYKSSLQARGEKIAEQAALPTLILGAITLPILGAGSAATILLASFGAQMRVVAPISVLNFLKMASEQAILIKDGRALEILHSVDTVVFDKTGTLTQEQPYVKAIHTCQDQTENDILCYAAAAEYKQKHPIALAIQKEAQNRHLDLPMIDEANYEIGYGLKVRLDDKLIRVGSIRFMTMEKIIIPPSILMFQTKSHDQGSSLVYVAVNEQLSGTIELQATIRPEAKQVIDNLHQRGMNIVIISGDHEQPTQQLAQELGIDQYFAETLPENKAQLIEKLQKEGRSVCFVGDGINDSIALKKANVSISLRGASTIATDTAQVILMDESLKQLPLLFDLANRLEKNMRTGFITAMIPGVMCVGGVYFFHIGVITAGVLYNISLGAGVGNAMLPKLRNR
ncbi:MAG: heavy metal translocating P-type ATPase [Candidatus Parabeggiatoa sp.]|nr:heavy metal translocating P-type ATPase [Candidatus Parabeggiatoa sp.]